MGNKIINILIFILLGHPFYGQSGVADIPHRQETLNATLRIQREYQKLHKEVTESFTEMLKTQALFTMNTGKFAGVDVPVPMVPTLKDYLTLEIKIFTYVKPKGILDKIRAIRHPFLTPIAQKKRQAFLNYLKETYELSIAVLETAKDAELLDASHVVILKTTHNLLAERQRYYANKLNQYVEKFNKNNP